MRKRGSAMRSKRLNVKTRRPLARLTVLLAIPVVLPGCSALFDALKDTNANNIPASVQNFARAVPRVENYANSPCWQQVQIAKNQAFLETASQGEKVVREVVPKCAREKKRQEKVDVSS